jgi:hypothetical protein
VIQGTTTSACQKNKMCVCINETNQEQTKHVVACNYNDSHVRGGSESSNATAIHAGMKEIYQGASGSNQETTKCSNKQPTGQILESLNSLT